jgi:hypothetical protein
LEELKVEAADEKLGRYKSYWPRHVTRMNNSGIPPPPQKKSCIIYEMDEDNLGRPSKILIDEAETGLLRPNS